MDALLVLTQQLKESKYAKITITPNNGATFEDYLSLIEYKPAYWKIGASKRIEKIIKYENWFKNSFKRIIEDVEIKSQDALDVYLFMSKIQFNDYAKLKLNKEQINLCYKRVSDYMNLVDYNIEDDEEVVKVYTNYLIRMITSKREDELDDNVKKIIKKPYTYK